jgi:hypothetical protein
MIDQEDIWQKISDRKLTKRKQTLVRKIGEIIKRYKDKEI